MKRARQLGFRLLLTGALLYAGICVFLLLGQNRLLYVGTSLPAYETPLALPHFNDAAGRQTGWVVAPQGAPPRGTVVFFHGNNEQAWEAALDYGPYFTARGWRVVFPEYRGFDFRKSLAPTHDTVIADAVAVMRLARQRFPGGPLWVAGNSLGAGIAAQAARAGGAQRVLLFVPWDSFGATAKERFPFLPIRLLLRAGNTEYDSCAALRGIAAPVFVIYAGQDKTIPPRRAQALAHCLALPKPRVLALSGATHGDWPAQLSPAQWDILTSPAQTRLITPPDRAKTHP